MSTTVTTQAQLDAAIAAHADIIIRSSRGVWLYLDDDSATVRASDSATVRAYGSSTIRASGSATVRASDSATVTASDSATVTAYGSSTVRASGSATVRASDSATVTAAKFVAVHLFSTRVTLTGGTVIDLTSVDFTDPATWAEYHGVTDTDGHAIVYKAVDADLNAGHNWTTTNYPIGGTVEATDWKPNAGCGHGLHFSPLPVKADGYYPGATAPRFLAVRVALADVVCLNDKIKARRCEVLHEVDVDGRRVTA